MLAELTLQAFINKIISNDPVPGGGSVSALNGAMAAALSAMVANLTVGRKKYAEVNDLMQELATSLENTAGKLLADVDRDSDAYNRVFAAFKMPKETDEEKAKRSDAIQNETKYAAQVPMEVARAVHNILPQIANVAAKGNSNAITDACVAMMCARTAVLGALLNAKINLSSIKDEAFVKAMTDEAAQLEADTIEQEQKLLLYAKENFGL